MDGSRANGTDAGFYEVAAGNRNASRPIVAEVTFLLIENFSLISFSSAIEPLRIANKVMDGQRFVYRCCTLDGSDVAASNGIVMRADCALEDVGKTDLLIICSSDGVERVHLSPSHKAKLRRHFHDGTSIAGICTGGYVLATLGLLNNRNCTIHWEYAEAFRELFPAANLVDKLIVSDGRIATCAGGTAALDLMLNFVLERCGETVRTKVAEIALHQDIRTGSEGQKILLREDLCILPPRLRRCMELMAKHAGEPLSQVQIAEMVDISPRQMQRDFKKYLNCSPQEYWMKIRMEAAQQMVRKTSMRVIEIAIACGFVDASHFARRYRDHHGVSPASDRRQQHAISPAR